MPFPIPFLPVPVDYGVREDQAEISSGLGLRVNLLSFNEFLFFLGDLFESLEIFGRREANCLSISLFSSLLCERPPSLSVLPRPLHSFYSSANH